MVWLRPDYGATWNGKMVFNNITYVISNTISQANIFTTNNDQSDYGYDTYFPDLYIKGVTIDSNTYNANRNVTVIRLSENDSSLDIKINIKDKKISNNYIKIIYSIDEKEITFELEVK